MLNRDVDPIISIVIPVYGTEQFFDRCIRSIQCQSYKKLEIIVVNDGSKGNISEIISNYTDDPRVKFINNTENRGLIRARVCGSRRATGDYIAFVDSDDYVSFDFYRTLLDKAQKTNSDITIGNTVWVNEKEKNIYNYHDACFRFDTLKGSEIKKAFFGQEYQCYSWHTIWNKLYKKDLWDKCQKEFEKVDRHIIMTEDLYFSSLLFYNAEKIAHTKNDAYFYCENENASTNSKQITIGRYCKNMADIEFVFDNVETYMTEQGADQYILESVYKGRQHYARMWRNLAENTFHGEELEKAIKAIEKYCKDTGSQNVQDDYYFESVKTEWNAGLEYIKKKIRDCSQNYISFDIFDTLIKPPFYTPKDLFALMDTYFSKRINNNISFSALRQQAEELARKKYGEELGVEDITIDEIYDFLSDYFGIQKELTKVMKDLEYCLEKKFCTSRETGVELFELAKALGKKTVLITDMYLDRNTIEEILLSNGINGYERLYISSEERCLKYNGRLFVRALSSLEIAAKDIIHIGDGWTSDIEGSDKADIESIFLPKTIEVFENKIEGCQTNRCSDIGLESCGEFINYQKVKESLGFRCMQAMVANEYFDNPYRTFNPESDFNMDPYFIGFYLLGMHITGVVKWINEIITEKRFDNVLFLARDGFLPMKAYEVYRKYTEDVCARNMYIQASRKALMPIMIKDPINLYQLPIEYRAHSPKTLCSVLDFMMKDISDEKILKVLKSVDMDYDMPFQDLEKFHRFVELFRKEFYDPEKHEIQKELVRKYYRTLPDNSIAFDMGYSGRIQAAICKASNCKIDAMFLHEDFKTASLMKENANFKIYSFYAYYPTISGLMREHLFSDTNGSCIGFEEDDLTVVPKIEKRKHHYPERYVVDAIQNGALTFFEQFMLNFSEYPVVKDFSPYEVSIPFEGFLRRPSKNDMHIFSASYFEDLVYGACDSINIETFAMQNLAEAGWIPKTKAEINAETVSQKKLSEYDENIINMINHSSQWKRAFIWILLDWKFFKEKLRLNIQRLMKRRIN